MPGSEKISAATDLFLIGQAIGGEPLSVELAGSKAAILSQMAKLGLNVPPAFVLSTRLCGPVNAGSADIEKFVDDMLRQGIAYLERSTGRRFGDLRQPLFVSVRSGAARSMPGMMATLLNVGTNAESARGLIRLSGNPRLAWDSYRRFVQEYCELIGGVDQRPFADRLGAMMQAEGVLNEFELDSEALERLTAEYLELATELLGSPVPSDPMAQLRMAALAVFRSWETPKAREYRRLNALEDLEGTAVTVQTMVFGNSGDRSGAGVAFSRNPATGENALYADVLFDAQGEDVVSGRRVPVDIAALRHRMPEVAGTLASAASRLEREFRDMQDIEFTIEDGRLYFLQSRSGKRTPRAALAILIELVRERIIDEADGARRAAEIDIEAASVTRFTGDAKAIARGVPASTGVASGRAAFDSESAALLAKSGDPVILIRTDTSTDDIAGFAAAAGVLTAIGGRTAHAAVVARQLGKVCVVGCSALTVNSAERSAIISGQNIAEGAWISLDGDTGAVFIGKREIVIDRPLAAIQEVDRWMAEAKSRQSQRKSPGS